MHPSHENNGKQFKIAHIINFLSQCEELKFIFEHTPHCNPSKELVQEGYDWIRKNIINS